MIFGVGLDIIEVERIEKAAKSKKFIKRVFCEAEIEMFKKRKFKPQVIAGNFAAKEATLKALGIGISSGFLCDIEILRYESGKPYINLKEAAKQYADKIGELIFFVSLSNLKDIAAAQVIVEKID